MKAKVKTTGEIIDVSRTENIITSRGVEKQYVDNKREWCTYVQSELEFICDIDNKKMYSPKIRLRAYARDVIARCDRPMVDATQECKNYKCEDENF